MTTTRRFVDGVIDAIRRAGRVNRDDQTEPAAILWPDRERVWEPLLPQLRGHLPILTLGPYDPSTLTGPSYWIRCVLAGTLDDLTLPVDGIPVIYLPGVSRTDIRAVETCPVELQPLAELQYRGVLWTHRNGRDWTVTGFLSSSDGGLGIEVTSDDGTKRAVTRTVATLADVPIDRLTKGQPLRASFFDELLVADPVKSVLLWLDDPDLFRAGLPAEVWSAFAGISKQRFGFDPTTDGPITAASLLGKREENWASVWERFAESPRSYPGIPDRLRAAHTQPQMQLIFHQDSWPQVNQTSEDSLRKRLLDLRNAHPDDARRVITDAERDNRDRRNWVWSQLGDAPLANAVEHLAKLAEVTNRPLGGASIDTIAQSYTDWGWQADDAALRALASVSRSPDVEAVTAAVESVYREWLESAAIEFQSAVKHAAVNDLPPALLRTETGTCILFTDALRFDVARRLSDELARVQLSTDLDWRLAALPSVTPTAKPAVSPVADRISGASGFDTTASGGVKLTADSLRKQIAEAGFQILRGTEVGDSSGRGWTEMGAIDVYGHQNGAQLARHIDPEVRAIAERVQSLIDAGWRKVVVVTDHGWLLLPSGLPKHDLPLHLTDDRKGRCARLKPGSDVTVQTVRWHWDPLVTIAVAPGISCFEAGKQYEHGGLSPQECVIPVATVTSNNQPTTIPITIESVVWRGLRCTVEVTGRADDLSLDIRRKPADSSSSLALSPATLSSAGRGSVLVEDEDSVGEAAVVVILDTSGMIVAQRPEVVGGVDD